MSQVIVSPRAVGGCVFSFEDLSWKVADYAERRRRRRAANRTKGALNSSVDGSGAATSAVRAPAPTVNPYQFSSALLDQVMLLNEPKK